MNFLSSNSTFVICLLLSAALHGLVFAVSSNGDNTDEMTVTVQEGINSIPVKIRQSVPKEKQEQSEQKEFSPPEPRPIHQVISSDKPTELAAPIVKEKPPVIEREEQKTVTETPPEKEVEPREKPVKESKQVADKSNESKAEPEESKASQAIQSSLNEGADTRVKPQAIACPQPPYPAQALRESREGTVRLSVIVNNNGRARRIRIIQSSGHKDMDCSAVKTVRRKWRFSRPENSSNAKENSMIIEIKFRITN